MRIENIEVTFKIPIPVGKPDLNGVIYSKEAIRNAYKNVKNIPIEMPNNDGQFLPIGVTITYLFLRLRKKNLVNMI